MAHTYDELAAADSRLCVLNLQLGNAGPGMTPETAHAGIEALSTALRDPDLGVIVLTGSAEEFCIGVPVPVRSASAVQKDENTPAFIDALHDWLLALRESNKLTIAAVEGQASGAGLALALACDLIVAARHARFALPVASQVSGRNAGALWLAAQSLPRGALAELSLLDAAMPAERAHALGLVCKLTERGLALQQATQLARAALQRESASLALLKGQITRAMEQPLHEILAEERALWLRRPVP